MKRILAILGTMLIVSSMSFAAEGVDNSSNKTKSKSKSESESTETAVTISKGDSFMVAFGMADSSLVGGGEAGGISSTAGAAAVAGTAASTGSSNLTSSQNTPYTYK
ncbi:hypothetical protein [Cetobacterium sp.]|uniref:hypothetical protein n=1 Tax=Cetobacterium sp. TaxID=2071632 RepID=UPI003F39D1D6